MASSSNNRFRRYRGVSALEALLDIEEEDDITSVPLEFFNIKKVDNILLQFFQQYPLRNLLSNVESYNSPVQFDYKFDQVTYVGTVFNYRWGLPTPRNILTIRLSNDGYRYQNQSQQFISLVASHPTRNSHGWYIMNQAFASEMEYLLGLLKERKMEVTFYYHYLLNRMEFHFREPETNELIFIVCLENVNPKADKGNPQQYYKDMNIKPRK